MRQLLGRHGNIVNDWQSDTILRMRVDPARVAELLINEATDDYLGLHEIIWSLNVLYPDVDEGEKIRVAQSVVAQALTDMSCELFETVSWPPKQYIRLTSRRPLDVVNDSAAWRVQTEPGTNLYWVACR